MRLRPSRILDTTAIVAAFHAHRPLLHLLDQADAGVLSVYLPAVCVAEAGPLLATTPASWEAIQYIGGVHVLPLLETAAVEIGSWPGPLQARHAAYEARHFRTVVVTCDPAQYAGLPVDLRVV